MAAGDTLYTYYTGILNENAKVYNDGKQDNKAYLEYSNNPHDNKTTNKTRRRSFMTGPLRWKSTKSMVKATLH